MMTPYRTAGSSPVPKTGYRLRLLRGDGLSSPFVSRTFSTWLVAWLSALVWRVLHPWGYAKLEKDTMELPS